jgi:hypothetical protein
MAVSNARRAADGSRRATVRRLCGREDHQLALDGLGLDACLGLLTLGKDHQRPDACRGQQNTFRQHRGLSWIRVTGFYMTQEHGISYLFCKVCAGRAIGKSLQIYTGKVFKI